MFGQVDLRSGQVDFLSTCQEGQVGFEVNVEPCVSSIIFTKVDLIWMGDE